jgi:hypothetical protein
MSIGSNEWAGSDAFPAFFVCLNRGIGAGELTHQSTIPNPINNPQSNQQSAIANP